jgi:carbamoyl-phosphate synthase large subunit
MRSGETDGATTVDHAELCQLGKYIAERLHHVANLDVDVFADETGFHVLELNARFGGGYPFSHLAGANIPAAIVAWLQGAPCDPTWFDVAYGITAYKSISVILAKDFEWIDGQLPGWRT